MAKSLNNERENVKVRMANYRKRLRESGQKPREIWATDPEVARLRAMLAVWREEPTDLDPDQAELAAQLKPTA